MRVSSALCEFNLKQVYGHGHADIMQDNSTIRIHFVHPRMCTYKACHFIAQFSLGHKNVLAYLYKEVLQGDQLDQDLSPQVYK